MTTLPNYIPKGTKEEIRKTLEKWVGHKVVRGPTWQWNDQDKDSEFGIVDMALDKTHTTAYQIRVKWQNGGYWLYRVGNDHADVVLLHPEEVYNKIQEQMINNEYPNAFYESMDILPGDQITLKNGKEFRIITPRTGDSNKLIYMKNGYEYYAAAKDEIKMVLRITPRKNIRQKQKKEKKERYKLIIELPEKFYIT